MSRVIASRQIPASAQRVWEVISDYGGVHRFHPFVESSPILSSNDSGMGAERRCELYDRRTITEKVVDWRDGESFTVAITESPMPFNNATGTMSVQATDAQSSIVTTEIQYTPKFGPIGWVMDRLMIQPMMAKMVTNVLRGLEQHVKTGKRIGKGGLVQDQGATPQA